MAKGKTCPGPDKCPGMAKKDEEIARLREALEFAREAARINITMWSYKNEVILLDVIKCADCLLDGKK